MESIQKRKQHQRLPASGPAREALRGKGQFWTPAWIAEAMVAYVLQGRVNHLFDPAVGAGAFFHAAKVLGQQRGQEVALLGCEVDAQVLHQAMQSGLTPEDLASVWLRNFVLDPPDRTFGAIVANPPYIRHHRLPLDVKAQLKSYSQRAIGVALDGRAGLHVYFLVRALQLLEYGGHLAFILPADVCEGKFAPPLWRWITEHYRINAVVTFAPEATPFPQVDTNAVIFFVHNSPPTTKLSWAQCLRPDGEQLRAWVESGFGSRSDASLRAQTRGLDEALATGFSRPPSDQQPTETTLADFATVMRGIATGANDFFFLTRERADALGIPDEFLVRAVGRTRDVEGAEVTAQVLDDLDHSGRPTLLLSLDGRPMTRFPSEVQTYLEQGASMRLPERPLISQRKPWYKMESRPIPPLLFAYLGRRNVRFIRNHAQVLPLTGFLCVYPRQRDAAFVEKLWQVLSHPATVENLARVGKSYGAGAIKVEPRALESLPIPDQALRAANLEPPRRYEQARLLERVGQYSLWNDES